jgi:TPR repeat protein
VRLGPFVLVAALVGCGAEAPSPAPEGSRAEAEPPEAVAPGHRSAPGLADGTSDDASDAEAHAAAMRARASDPAGAARSMEAGCDRGYAPSCVVFAEMLEAGEGVDADAARAEAALEQACMGGSTEACDRLGH